MLRPMPPSFPLCSVMARGHGLDPVGHAPVVDLVLAFEMPLPWPYRMWDAPSLPREIADLVRIWYGDPDVPRPRLRPIAIAPEEDGPGDGLVRVALWSRPAPPFARFDVDAYRVPPDRVGPLVWALLLEPARLDAFEAWRVVDRDRHLLVCTHGTVDPACGRFGYRAYRGLRALAPAGTRILRASHFGGHLFAPTVLDLPSARYWAFLDGEAPAALLAGDDPVALRDRYRGWAGMTDPFLQVAEREAWAAHGPTWPSLPRRGEVVRRDDAPEPRWAEVRLTAEAPDGNPFVVDARVERIEDVRTPKDSGDDPPRPYAQYAVTSLRRNG